MHEGHRKRMLERLCKDAQGLQDHELLELLLFYAIPRKNTNPLAHDLLAAFGSLKGVLEASYEQLLAVEGVGGSTACFLIALGALAPRAALTPQTAPQKAFNVNTFSAFLTEQLGGLKEEAIELYCLDAQDNIRFTKRYLSGERDRAFVDARQLSGAILAQHSHAIVVAHNHPSASSRPSPEDDRFTAELSMICSLNGIRFYDHIIVGTDGPYSYFLQGRLEQIKENFAIDKIVRRTDLI